ncbi:hypothetical protein [Pedobacter nototheniae]|uniref:hypothetical protein n=1 Tax=Pedobacter nototheniae TaxID=2488994 RepID=UPI00292F65E0|nr:hypothetical protein [Pedobacter nototheniae]
MKKVLTYLLAIVLNIAFYFFLSVLIAFAVFAIFGEGQESHKYSFWVSLFFLLFQMLFLYWLYKKQFLIKDKILLIVNVLITLALFLFFVVYLSGAF